MVRAVLIVSLLAGCYEPAIESCQYTCHYEDGASTGTCPDGLECNAQGKCATTKDTMCVSPGCGWPKISNVDPCSLQLHAHTIDSGWNLNGGGTYTINTDRPDLSPLPPPSGVLVATVQIDEVETTVLVVGAMNLNGGAVIQFVGKNPLVLLVNGTLAIGGGGIVRRPAFDIRHCDPENGYGKPGASGFTDAIGGGGGGGGFFGVAMGDHGGQGGTGIRDIGDELFAVGGIGGVSNGREDLVPLRGGCSGGPGGFVGGVRGAGGEGGGALQIAARNEIYIDGFISAPGGGGQNAPFLHTGGGGGGSGGGILIEAPTVRFASGALLCANGGGGGAAESGVVAEDGPCTLTARAADPGAVGSDFESNGGYGGTRKDPAGPGQTGHLDAMGGAKSLGGGGGGGGVGRIRVNGDRIGDGSMTASPIISEGPLPP